MEKFEKFILDPGHASIIRGKIDPGCVAGGLREADATLWTANHLEGYLLSWAAAKEIVWTRKGEPGPHLRDRMQLAGPNDFYLSIHYNCFNKEAHGGEIWLPSRYVHTSAAKQLDKAMKFLYEEVGIPWRGIKDASKWGKRGMFIERIKGPAILWEVGFLKWDVTKDDFTKLGTFWTVNRDSWLHHVVSEFPRILYLTYLTKI